MASAWSTVEAVLARFTGKAGEDVLAAAAAAPDQIAAPARGTAGADIFDEHYGSAGATGRTHAEVIGAGPPPELAVIKAGTQHCPACGGEFHCPVPTGSVACPYCEAVHTAGTLPPVRGPWVACPQCKATVRPGDPARPTCPCCGAGLEEAG